VLVASGSVVLAAVGLGALGYHLLQFPPDTQPEGAYLRITYHLSRGEARSVFYYLEDAAQHAAFTIRDFRTKASDLIAAHFPEPERSKLLDRYREVATAPDGADVFLILGRERGWIERLRKDLSGIASLQIEGERATIVTARDTRYSFRRRQNGIWGLTMFTTELIVEADRAARDFDVILRASEDYASGG